MAITKDEAVELLRNGIAKLSTSEAFVSYLEFSSKFHQYSLHNTYLILAQTQGQATMVAGFNKWRDEFGRFVKRGEKGIAIFAPMFKKEERADGTKHDALIGFRIVYVFDVAQTEGKPIPERILPTRLEGEDAGLFALLAEHVTQSGLSLNPACADFPDERNGDYSKLGKEIRIRAGLSPVQKLKTLAHEVAHWKLHSDEKGEILPREVKETEAEAAAFLALARFGIRADAYSFAYIADWSRGNLKTLESSLTRIKRAADQIEEAIRSRLPEGVTPSEAAAESAA